MRVLPSLVVVLCCFLLGAGQCGPADPSIPDGPDGPDDGCALSCDAGRKVSLDGLLVCECRDADCTANEPPAPAVNPATGDCTAFATDCDRPAAWANCAACAANACGPAPGGTVVCADGSIAGVLGCSRTEFATCEWAVMECPVF